MADSTKLSVEKALEKIRQRDEPKSENSRLDEKPTLSTKRSSA